MSRLEKKRLRALGDRVRTLRNERGLTLKALGQLVSKNAQSINRLEMGNVNPGYFYLLQICEGLGIDMVQLLGKLPRYTE